MGVCSSFFFEQAEVAAVIKNVLLAIMSQIHSRMVKFLNRQNWVRVISFWFRTES